MENNNLDQDQIKKELDEEYREVTGDDPALSTDKEVSEKGKKSEETKEKTKEEKSEESKEPEKSKEAEELSEGEREEVESPNRPEKYIPIPKYQEDKRKWKEEEEKLSSEISRLQKELEMKGGEKKESEELESEEDIKKFAEDHVMDEDTVRDLVRLISKRNRIPNEIKEDLDKIKKEREEREDQLMFEEEFERDVMPLIKERYPNASQKSINQVKEDLDALAHTRQLHNTPLNYIFTYEQSKYNELLNPPKKKTAESGSMGRKEEGMSYADIYNLPLEERAKYIESFSNEEYEKFMEYVVEKEGTGATIHREGKQIEKL